MNSKMVQSVIKGALFVLVTVNMMACTKNRSDTFVQGAGENLKSVADYDGKVFDVETLGEITGNRELKLSTKSTKVATGESYKNWSFVPVKVNTKAELLADTPFIARPNDKTSYKIKYQITNSYLVVLKLAKAKDLHPSEAVGAFKQENSDLLGVPLVGYPISGFYNIDHVQSNGEKTNKLMEKTILDKTGAKFFKINAAGKTIYKAQAKLDVIDKSYFSGEWYYAETVIATRPTATEGIGENINYDQDLNPANKIKFAFTENELRGYNTNVDDRLDLKKEVNQNTVINIPVEWKDYRATPKGSNKDFEMSEEENENIEWQKRNYAKLKFDKTATTFMRSNTLRLVDFEIDSNYFSYTVHEDSTGTRIKYSFLNTSGRKPYVKKLHLKDDFEKFGFFTTKKVEFNNFEKYKKSDFERNTFINRFNVANGEIKFYFTEESDDALVPTAAAVVEEWDKAFAKAGVPLKITVDTKKRVALGDLRYNAINLIKSVNGSNLFGFGPSITDPNSGEIISATTNMHLTSIQGALADHIRNYLLYKSGRAKNATIYIDPPELKQSVQLVNNTAVVGDQAQSRFYIPKLPVNVGGKVQLLDLKFSNKSEGKQALRKSLNWGREFDIGVTGKNLNLEIEKQCPEIASLVESLKQNPDNPDENKFVIDCSNKLVVIKMTGTLLHEMGHNFGLRHNFYASTDAKNFLSKTETGTDEVVKSSSVMEYPSFGEDRLTKVGKYDIAAIRYGYADSVEIEDGATAEAAATEKEPKVEKLSDLTKSISDNLKLKHLTDKSYKFCTDEDVELNDDPMCARHDSGTTPKEIVHNIIMEYNASIATYNYRFDRAWGIDPMRLTYYRLFRYWVGLKRFYDEWRFRLSDNLGIGNGYLENMTTANYDIKLKALAEKNPQFAEDLKLWRPVAREIFDFAKQMAVLPPRYCIGQRNGNLAAVEFSDVRKSIYFSKKKVAATCLDADVIAFVKDRDGFEPTNESGWELDDVRYNMDPKASKDPLDVIGLMPEKMNAVMILTGRYPLSAKYEEKQLVPNFLDEPEFRDEMLKYVADRLTTGLETNKLIKGSNTPNLEKFKSEKRSIENLVTSIFYDGLPVPEKDEASRRRKAAFSFKYTDKKETLEKAVKKVLSPDGTNSYVVIDSDATEAIKLLNKIEMLPKRIEAAVPVTEETFVGLTDLGKVLDADGQADGSKLGFLLKEILDDEFNDKVGTKTYVRSKEQKEMDKHRVHWKKLLSREIGLMRADLQTATEAGSDGTPDWGIFNSITGKKIFDLMKAKDPTYNLNRKILQSKIDAYVLENKPKAGVAINNDIYEFDELQTQYELILNLLRRIADYQ